MLDGGHFLRRVVALFFPEAGITADTTGDGHPQRRKGHRKILSVDPRL